MNNNNRQNARPQGVPQQQLSPPTDPRKRNIPSTITSSQTSQQRARTSGLRQIEKYNTAMPMTVASPLGPEHPPVYGYAPQPVPQPVPPSPNVMAFRDVLLMPPPPPPPLPPMPAPPLAPTAPVPPMYTASPSVTPTFSCSHQIPKEFDPTQPPPILRPQLNAPRKRGATDTMQAGPPSKIRHVELPDGPCDDCVQKNIRASIYDEQNAKVDLDLEASKAYFITRTDHLENGKLWLKSILTPRQYLLLENYIENDIMNNFFSEPTPSSSFASLFQETPVAPRQSLVLQLLEAILGGARNLNNSVTHPQPSLEDSLMQMLSGGGRRSSAAESSLGVLLEAISVGSSSAETATTSSSSDRLHAVIEALRPAAESEQRASGERAGGSSNGLSRLANGGIPSAPSAVSTPAPYVRRSGQAAAPPARPYYTQTYPPPVPAPTPGSGPQSAPLPPYYSQQSQQQPARPFYAPRFAPGAPQPSGQQFAPPFYATARPPLPDPRAQPPSNQYFGPSYPPYYPTAPTGPSGPSGPTY